MSLFSFLRRALSLRRRLVLSFCALGLMGVLLNPTPTSGQALPPLRYEASVFGAGSSTGELPFWLSANEYGTIDRGAANLGVQLAVERPFSKTRALDYALGVDVLARASEYSTLHAHELYGQLRYWKFQLTAGWKEQTIGLVDSTLSMGSMMTSGNAPPFPRVSISTPHYVSVPGTRGFISFKGYFAHGWFPDDRFVSGAYLHQKYLYGRIFPPDFPVQLHSGITHAATWGGTHPELGNLADGLDDFWTVITSQSTDDPDAKTGTKHVLGSALGSFDFGITFDAFGMDGHVSRQFYVETAAGAQFRNVWDGLWSASLRWSDDPQIVEKIAWEHLYTKRQSAQMDDPDLISFRRFGHDIYYSNSIYRSGWVLHGRTIGNPLLFSDGEHPGVDNNIVIAHHVGLQGTLAGTPYRLFGTWSRNYGSRGVCTDPACSQRERRISEPPLTQWSFLAEASRTVSKAHGLSVRAAVSYDTGEVYEERVGARLGITWRGLYGQRSR